MLDLCSGDIAVERKLYLELCQRHAMKGGALVEYDGIAYQKYEKEVKVALVGSRNPIALVYIEAAIRRV